MFSLKKFASTYAFLVLVISIIFSFYYLMPSKTAQFKIDNQQFSQQKALQQLQDISRKAHYVGAPAHNQVRDYLVTQLQNLGLNVEVQTQLGVNNKWHSATQAQNILTKIKGTGNGKALLLLSHYDSNPHSSLGASDDGSGIVTILEGLRAYLKSNPKPKNDIIILFTDAEEIGLNGADAFVNHHPWAKNVGLVLNFEARGSGGPSYMLLETNGGNAELIKAFNKAKTKYPVANSLMYSIYKMLPNDTDLTVFRQDANINGFNFAFIGDHFDYHTAQDSYERLDRNTLMHQASYLLPLLSYFSNANLNNLNSPSDVVYFNFPFLKLVSFPYSWVWPLNILAVLLFVFLVLYGLMQGRLNLKEIFKGFIPFLTALLACVIVGVYGWKLLLWWHPQYRDILHGFTYNGYYYIGAFAALYFAITYAIYNKFKKINHLDLSVAPLFIWLIINILIAKYLTGAAFLIIPVFFALRGLSLGLFSKDKHKNWIFVNTLLALPLVVIFAPLLKMFPVGLGLKNLFISGVFLVLIFGLMTSVFMNFKTKRILAWLAFACSLTLFIMAGLKSDYTVDRRQPNSILYVYDADVNQAFWETYNHKIDKFTEQFLGKNPIKGGIDKNTTASKYGTGINWHQKAKLINLKPPLVINNNDSITPANTYKFTITPQRAVNRMELIANNKLHFKTFILNGAAFKVSKDGYVFNTETRKQILSYYFTKPNESIQLEFSLKNGEKPNITIYEASYDLFNNSNFKIKPRSEIMMPTPFVLNDAIVVKKQLVK